MILLTPQILYKSPCGLLLNFFFLLDIYSFFINSTPMQKELNVNAVIGYKGSLFCICPPYDPLLGSVQQGLILHPDNEHIIYSLGSTVVVRNIVTRTQEFLRGHDNEISCITVSPSGKYIASGQKTHMGFQVISPVFPINSPFSG